LFKQNDFGLSVQLNYISQNTVTYRYGIYTLTASCCECDQQLLNTNIGSLAEINLKHLSRDSSNNKTKSNNICVVKPYCHNSHWTTGLQTTYSSDS